MKIIVFENIHVLNHQKKCIDKAARFRCDNVYVPKRRDGEMKRMYQI